MWKPSVGEAGKSSHSTGEAKPHAEHIISLALILPEGRLHTLPNAHIACIRRAGARSFQVHWFRTALCHATHRACQSRARHLPCQIPGTAASRHRLPGQSAGSDNVKSPNAACFQVTFSCPWLHPAFVIMCEVVRHVSLLLNNVTYLIPWRNVIVT